jgi:Na+/H+-dicarboxylate symporter
MKPHWRIAVALALAVIVGAFLPAKGVHIEIFSQIGTLFLNALKMLVAPLIAAAIVQGLSGLADPKAVSRMGGKAVLYYLSTCLMAVLVGLLMINWLEPGIVDGEPAGKALGLLEHGAEVQEKIAGKGAADIWGVFNRMVPSNVFQAASEGNMLGLIFFSILFGSAVAFLPAPLRDVQTNFWKAVHQAMITICGWVMLFAPLGVFVLVAKTVAITGAAAFKPLAVFFIAVVLGLAIQMFVLLPATLKLVAGISPIKHFKAMLPALLTAFSSSSSAATLPVTLDCLENRAKVPSSVTNFVLPLGSTINLDGTALYECAVAMFIAQAYGLDLTFSVQFTIVTLALVTSMGVAGIPSASLVAISVILGAIGLPLEAVGVVLAVDRVLDMCRTTVNVFGDSCGAVVVARLEGHEVLKD